MFDTYYKIDIERIQDQIKRKKRTLNKLGFMYEEREKNNTIRFGVKPKWNGNPISMFSVLREQITRKYE